jgi:5'-nucleotidase
MKRILVTNDDGIGSPGISVLVRAMSGLGEITVVAPEREMSGISHALTLAQPLRMREVEEKWYSVSGTPTDCVYIGVVKLMGGKVDLVVSGINSGANLGEDVHYSGTVAGAIEGSIFGIPAIAFSQVPNLDMDLGEAAGFSTEIAKAVLADGIGPQKMLNVNFPPPPAKGVKLTRLGYHPFERSVQENVDPRGNRYYWIGGKEVFMEQNPDADMQAVRDGYVSVTPLQLDLTDAKALRELRNWKMFRGN